MSQNKKPKKSYSTISSVLPPPNLVQVVIDSFQHLVREGITEVLSEFSPISDFVGSRFDLYFEGYDFQEPPFSEEGCYDKNITYFAPWYVNSRLEVKEKGETRRQRVFFGEFPWITPRGTFIINGTERVVVSQLIRSPGVYYESDDQGSYRTVRASLFPQKGAWIELEIQARNIIVVKIERKASLPVTTLLRAIGYESDEEILNLFKDIDERSYVQKTIEHDLNVRTREEAFISIHKRLYPGEPSVLNNAILSLQNLLFDPQRYDLGEIGRYKLNWRLGLSLTDRTLTREDLVEAVRHLILIAHGEENSDDIDHLGNRHLRMVGDLLQNQVRIGFTRMRQTIKDRMSIVSPEEAIPQAVINIRPLAGAIRDFFSSSQLSQFMDQTNPLASLAHRRRLSAMGPGGLSRERAGIDVRDVHYSHYGRICPIETPEGPNIGLLTSLAIYSKVDKFGFIQTPYRRVIGKLNNTDCRLQGRTLDGDILDEKGGVVFTSGTRVDSHSLSTLGELPSQEVSIVPFASPEVVYLTALEEEDYAVAQANSRLSDEGEFLDDRVEARRRDEYFTCDRRDINYMDVSPKQVVSVSTALIPFLEHDDANRALMGSNMQRQAVPLIHPEAPIVSTGIEERAAQDSGELVVARRQGRVKSVTSERIIVQTEEEGEEEVYRMKKFVRTNQGTCVSYYPTVGKGEKVEKGQVLADGSAMQGGELALGRNVLVALMSWEGYNYEDAIIISESLVRDDKFTSIHIEEYEIEARDTKVGPEEITRDIPNVGEEALRNLDESGIVRVGAELEQGDILVGKITPRGETELTAEAKLLRAIFGEKARETKNSSLLLPHGERGTAIGVKILTRADQNLSLGVNKLIKIWVAQRRKICEGDKLSGRHGNKGVVGRILPVEDMPYLHDGTPVEVILNPLGVPSRMNLGQVLEAHLGLAAHTLGFRAITPVFEGATQLQVEDELARAWMMTQSGASSPEDDKLREWLKVRGEDYDHLFSGDHQGESRRACLRLWLNGIGISCPESEMEEVIKQVYEDRRISPPTSGKTTVYDGRTGEPFDQPITVGYMYIMKLIHLVEDKIHARSTGPYSLITQQPLGGKAQFGGQRFGEMEVWALEAYGAAYTLQEMLTIKSDDIPSRSQAYEAIIRGEDISPPGIPESFKILIKELQSLGLSVEARKEEVVEEEKLMLPESDER